VGGGFVENQTIIAINALFKSRNDETYKTDNSQKIAQEQACTHHQDLFFDLSPAANHTEMTCGGLTSVHLEKSNRKVLRRAPYSAALRL